MMPCRPFPNGFRLAAVCMLAAVAACSPKVQTRIDSGPIAARTFAFVARSRPEPPGGDALNPVNAAIQEAIANDLEGKGLRRVASSPDLMVAYLIVIGDKTSTRAIDTYFGRGRLYSDLLDTAFEKYTGKDNPTNMEAGTLLIDILDGRTAAIVMRNHVTRPILQDPSPQLRAAQIQEAVDQALAGLRITP